MSIKFVKIPAGEFMMGASTRDGHPFDKELPQVKVKVKEFEIAETTVTNAQFKEFVDATGYVTEAEKYNASFVFYRLLNKDDSITYKEVEHLPWWLYVQGADWQHPTGPNSSIEDIMDHPVVHVSYIDALAFCEWGNYRLPSEAEWEYAARAGSTSKWPWGDEFAPNGKYMANIWQGEFPYENTLEDGFLATCPAKYYDPNNFGLYNIIGNVWEWCSNPRRIDLNEFAGNDFIANPPYDFESIDGNEEIAVKGGSFLCHNSYCNRYRLGARNGNTANSTASNCGFRVCR